MIKILPLFVFAVLLISLPAQADISDCKMGIEATNNEAYSQAIDLLSKCIEPSLKNGPKSYVLAARAGAYSKTDQPSLAVNDQLKSIALEEPENVWPNLMLGVYYRELKQYDKSLEAINSAFKYDEDGPGTGPGMACYYHKGKTLHQAGRLNEAIESFTLGIAKQPDYGYALYERALSYEALGNKIQAKRDLFRVYELTPNDGYEPDIALKLKEYGFDVKVKAD